MESGEDVEDANKTKILNKNAEQAHFEKIKLILLFRIFSIPWEEFCQNQTQTEVSGII